MKPGSMQCCNLMAPAADEKQAPALAGAAPATELRGQVRSRFNKANITAPLRRWKVSVISS